jgi:hypothetical protein
VLRPDLHPPQAISARLARDTHPRVDRQRRHAQPLHLAGSCGLHSLFEICDRLTRLVALLGGVRTTRRRGVGLPSPNISRRRMPSNPLALRRAGAVHEVIDKEAIVHVSAAPCLRLASDGTRGERRPRPAPSRFRIRALSSRFPDMADAPRTTRERSVRRFRGVPGERAGDGQHRSRKDLHRRCAAHDSASGDEYT